MCTRYWIIILCKVSIFIELSLEIVQFDLLLLATELIFILILFKQQCQHADLTKIEKLGVLYFVATLSSVYNNR